jgi:hypothetical protein
MASERAIHVSRLAGTPTACPMLLTPMVAVAQLG